MRKPKMKMLTLPPQAVPMSYQAGGNSAQRRGTDTAMSGAAMQMGRA
jgi:hypothetical protein